MRRSWCSVVLLVFAVATIGASEVYKWVDADGVVHYSDKPPPNGQSIEIGIADDPPERDTSGSPGVYDDVIEQQRIRKESLAKEREEADRALRAREEEESKSAEACSQAIHYLNTLRKQCPVFYDGAGILRAQCPGYYYFYEGDRTYIEDDERQALIEHYSTIVDGCRRQRR